MAYFTVGLKVDPNDFTSDDPAVTPLVVVTADGTDSPITAVSLSSDERAADWYAMTVQAMHEYEKATGDKMTPLHVVRFFGQSALLNNGKA